MGTLRNELKSNFTQIPNQLLFDSRISFGARILFCYLASKPNNWKIINQDIIDTLQVSCDSIAKYFKELLNVGWISREREIDEHGQFCGGYDYTVYYKPNLPKKSELEKTPNKEKVLIRKKSENINNTKTTNNTNISNNINNSLNKNNNINNINNKQEYIVEINRDDKIIYTGFKEILDKDKENSENKPQKPTDDTNTPKIENNAKKSENKPTELKLGVDTKPKNTKKKFIKPTKEQVKQYIIANKLVNVDAETFYDHYESNGWYISNRPMKDWQATLRNWNRRALSFQSNNNKSQNKNNIFYDRLKEMEEQENNGVML